MRRLSRLALLLALSSTPVVAAEFVVSDIRVEGLQRISAGTVFNYLPAQVGETLRQEDYPELIRTLFRTGFFTDVQLGRDGDVLVVRVVERPAIAEIKLTGNRDISSEDLRQALREVGLAEGRVFDRSLLEKLEQELLNQYYARGKYAVRVETEVTPLERNRVALSLDISEGVAARIRRINIVGNRDFSDERLLDEFQLSTTGWFSFFTRSDQYSKQKLAADLETLRSFYLDRGYLKFQVDSTQVSITPDKKDIYVTVNVTEGERYSLSRVELAGELIVPREELETLVTLESGETFSRKAVNQVAKAIADRLGDDGYAFANVNPVPELDEEARQVRIVFVVDPGRRVYVRRINFEGNIKTHDEVLRREMRQMEGAWFSTADVNRSRTRLQRLGYLQEVNLETEPVAGSTDQVDLDVAVTERPSGNVIFGLGFGQDTGVLLNASLNQGNFLGTGKNVRFSFNNSSTSTDYSFGYTNPYYTLDGVSRGFDLYFREIDAGESNVADYLADTYGAGMNFGVPLNEFDVLKVGAGFEGLDIETTVETPVEVLDFLDEHPDPYLGVVLDASWARDSRNRAIFANRGMVNRIAGEITLPGSDLEYYKLSFKHTSYLPLTEDFTLSFKGDFGYGGGYGSLDELPFFEAYYAGGLRTVRGFKSNTLGPRFSNGEPSGGSVKVSGGIELILPVPFAADENSMRIAGFMDGGNVFESIDDVSLGELRFSVGVMGMWLTPIGPLAVSAALPLNDESDDDVESIQFSFGVPF